MVKTKMAAICGSDLHMVYAGISLPPFPLLPGFPGHEGVGDVVESHHPDFKVGDQVLCAPSLPNCCTFADYQTLGGAFLHHLPDYDGPLEHLLMAQQFGTTLFAMRRQPLDLVGKTVMVMGQGSAGMFFAWQAMRAGAEKVIVSDLNEARLASSSSMGADVAVKADATGENVRQAVMDHTKGLGVDYLVEAVGTANSYLQAVDLMKDGGEMLWFGLPDTAEPIRINFHDFFRKRLRAHSVYGTQHEHGGHSFRLALNLIASKQIDVSALTKDFLNIEKIDEAMKLAQDRSRNALKVSITFD